MNRDDITEGKWLTIRGHRFCVNQIAGTTVYLRLEGMDWDTPIPIDAVRDAMAFDLPQNAHDNSPVRQT